MSEPKKRIKAERETVAAYIAKHSLSGGIWKKNLTTSIEGGTRLHDASNCFSGYVLGKDCFLTEAEAVDCFEAMRANKIESLKRQIAKLEKMKAPEVKDLTHD